MTTTPLAIRRRAPFAIVLFALVLMPLVGHGCHRDDADHEPVAIPPQPVWDAGHAPHPR